MDGGFGSPSLSKVMMEVTVVEVSDIRIYGLHSGMKLHLPGQNIKIGFCYYVSNPSIELS
jgi:hypothetical protein